MRAVGFALAGFMAGGMAGLLSAFLFVVLWFDVLGIGDHGADGLSGFAAFMALGIILTLVGGLAGAIWMVRRANVESQRSSTMLVVLMLLTMIGLFGAFLIVGVI